MRLKLLEKLIGKKPDQTPKGSGSTFVEAGNNLLEELKETFPAEDVHPYGLVLVIPTKAFRQQWQEQLRKDGYKIYFQGYHGKTCAFIQLEKPLQNESIVERSTSVEASSNMPGQDQAKRTSKPWTPEEESMLQQLRSQNLPPQQIALKLHRSVGAVLVKLKRLKDQTTKTLASKPAGFEPANPTPATNQDQLVKELLQAAGELYPRYRHACRLLLSETSRLLETQQ